MRKFCAASLLPLVLSAAMLVACAEETAAPTLEVAPQIAQMRSICELATTKCYYHNVARYYEENASGYLWWTKDKCFWIEYAGIVTIGLDASQLSIEVQDDVVTITMPPAKILGCKVDETTLTEDSFIVDVNSAPIEAKDQTAAFKEAQDRMLQTASADTTLLVHAQQKAQKLLEDYVKNIGACVGTTYRIKWVYLEAPAPVQTTTTAPPQPELTAPVATTPRVLFTLFPMQ